jgi:hypothetical protein
MCMYIDLSHCGEDASPQGSTHKHYVYSCVHTHTHTHTHTHIQAMLNKSQITREQYDFTLRKMLRVRAFGCDCGADLGKYCIHENLNIRYVRLECENHILGIRIVYLNIFRLFCCFS